jgi:hypothetical protein
MRVLDYIVTISFGYILNCVCCNFLCNVGGVCMSGFCNVWVCICVGFVICGCFGNMCTCIYCVLYRVADKSLALPTSRFILSLEYFVCC